MPANSLNLFASARNISEQLRRCIETETVKGGESLATMQAALKQIEVLWQDRAARRDPRDQPCRLRAARRGRGRCANGAQRVQFRVRSIKVRRKNADGLCWVIRKLA